MRETPLVKICGLRRREDVVMADEQGADFLGVVMTSGFSRSDLNGICISTVQPKLVSCMAMACNDS